MSLQTVVCHPINLGVKLDLQVLLVQPSVLLKQKIYSRCSTLHRFLNFVAFPFTSFNFFKSFFFTRPPFYSYHDIHSNILAIRKIDFGTLAQTVPILEENGLPPRFVSHLPTFRSFKLKPNYVTLFIYQTIALSTRARDLNFLFLTHPRCQNFPCCSKTISGITMQQMKDICMKSACLICVENMSHECSRGRQ